MDAHQHVAPPRERHLLVERERLHVSNDELPAVLLCRALEGGKERGVG